MAVESSGEFIECSVRVFGIWILGLLLYCWCLVCRGVFGASDFSLCTYINFGCGVLEVLDRIVVYCWYRIAQNFDGGKV